MREQNVSISRTENTLDQFNHGKERDSKCTYQCGSACPECIGVSAADPQMPLSPRGGLPPCVAAEDLITTKFLTAEKQRLGVHASVCEQAKPCFARSLLAPSLHVCVMRRRARSLQSTRNGAGGSDRPSRPNPDSPTPTLYIVCRPCTNAGFDASYNA